MPTINITVAGKIATNTTPGEVIVCGNSDYSVNFALDSEWDAEPNRTARFVYYKDGLSLYQDVAFIGATVPVPVLSNIDYVLVGVYAGSLHTTTPAKVLCDRSILCGDPLEVVTPEEKAKLQAQIGDLGQLQTSNKDNLVAAINEAANSGGSGIAVTEKTLILTLFRNAAYTSADMGNVLTQLEALWSGGEVEPDVPDVPVNPEKTLTSISAVYSGGSVTAGTAVNALTDIVVTAHYSDGTSATVTGYTLSGTIAEGSNTITVSYGGKTTTFTVTGTAEPGGDSTDLLAGVAWTDGLRTMVQGNTYENQSSWTTSDFVAVPSGGTVHIEHAAGSGQRNLVAPYYYADKTAYGDGFSVTLGHGDYAGIYHVDITIPDGVAFVKICTAPINKTDYRMYVV